MPADVLLHPAAVPVPAAGGPTLNALTIDVEDYFHVSGFEACVARSQWDDYPLRVADNSHRLLDILDAAGVRGTFFVLGWVAERRPDVVKDIRAAGHEVASHGQWHRLIYRQTPEEFRADVRQSRDVLQDILGQAVTYHYFTDTVAGAALGIGTVCGLAFLLDLSVVRRWLARGS